MDWFGDTFFIISIHAPREGRDSIIKRIDINYVISIHAPREGRDAL